MQLEHNDQDYSDLLNSDSPDDKADESPERAILRHARHQSQAIADTGHTGPTGQHRSKRQHSVHRTHSARSDADDHRSTLINRTLQQHWLDLEYRSAADRSRHHSRSSRKDSGTHRATISLRHADSGELSPAEMLRHRRVRSRSRSFDSVSPRRHSRSPSRSRGKKKKSHKKRKHSSTSSSSRRRSSSSSRERSKHRHIYKKKKKHTNSHSSNRDKHVKKHKKKRSPSPSPSSSSSIVSSSCSSSSRQRSPARKRSRSRSRSSSSAEENSHVPAPRAVSPSLLWDGISLCADDDDQFNSHSEEHQDLIPDTEICSNASDIHSNMSSEDMKFQNLIEEVFKLLPADRFPRKTEGVLGGNKPRSSIEMELMKAPRKSLRLNLVRTSLRLSKLLRRISLLFLLDHHVEEMLLVGLVPEVEALAPLVEEPPPLGNTESQPPLPLPLLSRAPDSIIIPRLSNFCRKSDNFNRMLCPVRAVKIYLNKTKSLRKRRKRLFIPTQGDQDLAKPTLSRWVKYAIKNAYDTISKNPLSLFKPRAHELRAISASWAYMNYIPLEEILKSAVWSSTSLFASHYLRDFREQTENLRAMGLIIAAQKVVGGRANPVSHQDK